MADDLAAAKKHISNTRFAVPHLSCLRHHIWSIIMSIWFGASQTSHRNWLQIPCLQTLKSLQMYYWDICLSKDFL